MARIQISVVAACLWLSVRPAANLRTPRLVTVIDSATQVSRERPTNYMDDAVLRWQNRLPGYQGRAWQPVTVNGKIFLR